jgi:phosphate transport system permease protein
MKKVLEISEWCLLAACTTIVVSFLGIIMWDVFSKGMPALSWNFIIDYPTNGMTKGGIFPAILGTLLLTIITTIFSVPFGVACAVYLNEYAGNTFLTRLIRASIRNLAGIPSIIYGLFGLALFVQGMRFGTSLVSAGLTLGSLNQEFMALPYHLYMLSTQHQSIEEVRPLAYGTAVVLIVVVFLMNLFAFYIRYKYRKT